ncbi:MAG: helix-turn-helix transcriptional regulator [Hyphomicrobiaceae bacterium]|nr:MAG: helix-turn-helix transcriptional regulator [Hyphomicrobiaceae bacterium]
MRTTDNESVLPTPTEHPLPEGLPSSKRDPYLETARALRAELAKKRMTQEGLAELTGLSLATIGRALRGKFRPETLALITDRLGVSVNGPAREETRTAAAEFGSYHRDTVQHLVGNYLCARRGFANAETLVLYPMSISWAADPAGLRFEERNKVGKRDYSQSGYVHIPPGCSYMHLATIDRGSVRLITVSFVSDKLIQSEPIRGLILTLYNPFASNHVPAVSPIVLTRLAERDPRSDLAGVHPRSDPRLASFAQELEIAETQQSIIAIGRAQK